MTAHQDVAGLVRQEMWKPAPGYPAYEVSNRGRVRKGDLILRQQTTRTGYLLIHLWSNGVSKQFGVHRLVLLTFVGPCPVGMQCAHLDGNSKNNSVENLQWVSPKENARHRIIHGTQVTCETHPKAKLTSSLVAEIRKEYVPHSHTHGARAIARRLGLYRETVEHALKGITWRDENAPR